MLRIFRIAIFGRIFALNEGCTKLALLRIAYESPALAGFCLCFLSALPSDCSPHLVFVGAALYFYFLISSPLPPSLQWLLGLSASVILFLH